MRESLTKSEERVKDLGEVFTPGWLVSEMLDQLPEEIWTDHTKTYIDPACGDGNILLRVVRRKIKNGSTPLQALQTTYGVDIMEDNVQACRRRLLKEVTGNKKQINIEEFRPHAKALKANIKCANTLEQTLEDIFTGQE
jgi:type I restriction-modification system DNA methylase subunit